MSKGRKYTLTELMEQRGLLRPTRRPFTAEEEAWLQTRPVEQELGSDDPDGAVVRALEKSESDPSEENKQ